MKDLALAVTVIFGGAMIIGGVAGNRIAKNYGKSKVAGTLIGIGIGYIALVGYVRIKGKMEMNKLQQQQTEINGES
jgi:hypothetical protein